MLTCWQGLYRARNAQAKKLEGWSAVTKLAFLLALLPVWGDLHFYVTHRLLHIVKPLYTRIHKVHHRSKNVDPWSGLSMHPLEHVVYFSALAPFLLLPQMPLFAVRKMSDGLVTGPIPDHIGLWPFDRHHFQHHVEFNYNYGASPFFDVIFGTTFDAYKNKKILSESDKVRALEAARQKELTEDQ